MLGIVHQCHSNITVFYLFLIIKSLKQDQRVPHTVPLDFFISVCKKKSYFLICLPFICCDFVLVEQQSTNLFGKLDISCRVSREVLLPKEAEAASFKC